MDQPPVSSPSPWRRRAPLVLGGLLALAAGLGAALVVTRIDGDEPMKAPPASQGGLVIESGGEPGALEATRALRCFVAGQFVGELTLSECARRNGVATDALDVGLDETGALAAAQQAGALLTPLPPAEEAAEVAGAEEGAPAPAEAQLAACWRHQNGRWRKLPGDVAADACVQTLFAGRCLRPGQAQYGRWGHQTLRLVTSKVEVSDDNQSFRTMAAQDAACAIAPVG
jgi:hypothetical protein